MPPVVAAVGAVAGAIGTGVAAAGAAIGAAGIMTSLTYVGTAMTVAGAVTGNKKLMRWGSVAGLVGGLGAAGAFGTAAKNATFNSALGRTAATTAGKNVAANAASSLSLSPVKSQGLIASQQSLATAPSALDALKTTAASSPSIAQVPAQAGAWNAIKTGAGNLMQFAKDNPELAQVLANGAAGVADYLSGVPDAQLALLESQARGNDAASEKIRFDLENEKRRRANLNAGYLQVNSGVAAPNQATAAGNPFAPKPGLLSGAMA